MDPSGDHCCPKISHQTGQNQHASKLVRVCGRGTNFLHHDTRSRRLSSRVDLLRSEASVIMYSDSVVAADFLRQQNSHLRNNFGYFEGSDCFERTIQRVPVNCHRLFPILLPFNECMWVGLQTKVLVLEARSVTLAQTLS